MKRALIVVDVQESFRQRPSWAAMSNTDIAGQVGRLAAAARASGDLVVWVLHTEPGSGTVFDPANGYVRLIDGLTPHDGEPVIAKTSANAFTTTNLQRTLTAAGVGEIVICGIRTEQCCETTARVGSDLGFDVTFVTDATATTPIPAPGSPADQTVEQLLADPGALSAADIIERTERVLVAREFATIATTDEFVAAAQAVAGAMAQ
jgi:nicotinamidase-related amidase